MSVIHLSVVGTEGDPRSPSALLMRDENGQEYRVALTNGAARAPEPPAQLAMAVTTLSVREIQAALRAGRTRQDLADEFGVDPERVGRFEGPILAERAYVAQRAREVTLRRPDGPRALGDIVAERIHAQGDDAGSLEWDAWRRDDARWAVTATWLTLGSDLGDESWAHAQWIFDQVGLTIVPADDAATALVALPPTPEPASASPTVPAGGDPYTSNPTDDLTAIARAIREEPAREPEAPARAGAGWTPVVVTGGRAQDAAPKPAEDSHTDEVSPHGLASHTGGESHPSATPAADLRPEVPAALRDDADNVSAFDSSDDVAHDPDIAPALDSDAVTDWDETYDGVDVVDDLPDEVFPDITDTQPVTTFTAGERSRAASSKRRSVPSWDEILFGSSPTTRDPD